MTSAVTLLHKKSPIHLLLAGVLLLACQGPTGKDGSAGPTGPGFKRGADYCNNVTAPVTGSSPYSLTATCNAAADVPVEGFCYEPSGLPTGAALVLQEPLNWDVTTPAAGWRCTWAWISGTPAPFSGSVEICCATPQ